MGPISSTSKILGSTLGRRIGTNESQMWLGATPVLPLPAVTPACSISSGGSCTPTAPEWQRKEQWQPLPPPQIAAVPHDWRPLGLLRNPSSSSHLCLSWPPSDEQKQGTPTHGQTRVATDSHPGSQQIGLWGCCVCQVSVWQRQWQGKKPGSGLKAFKGKGTSADGRIQPPCL